MAVQFRTKSIRDAMELGMDFSATVVPTLSDRGWIVIINRGTLVTGVWDTVATGVWERQRGGDREFKTLDAAYKALTGELGIKRFEVSTGSGEQ